jgi:hypothetical protein
MLLFYICPLNLQESAGVGESARQLFDAHATVVGRNLRFLTVAPPLGKEA